MGNLKSKVLLIVAWFFGVMFILGALGFLLEGSLLAGLLILIAGILFLPPIKRLILDKEPRLSSGKITAAGCIALVVSALFVPTDDQPNDNKAEKLITETKSDVIKSEPANDNKVQEIPKYKIIEDTVKNKIKRTVEVELASRTNEEQLRILAKQIYALKDVDVQRTFISYRIAGDHKNQTYWATTHYDPELKVNIMGESASDYERMRNTAPPEGDVLGAWMVSWGAEYKSTAYQKDGKTYIHNMHSDGSNGDKIYELSKSDKGIKLQNESGKKRNEYFIINKEGNLEFWGEDDNYYTAPKATDMNPKQTEVKNKEVVLEKPKDMSRPQKNAVKSAKQYISMTGFSRNGLIEQLSSSAGDGYDVADATIAVDSLNINWNEQAARSAEQYLNMTGFSCNGLIEQLSSSAGSKYTVSEATYGAQQAGACS